MNRLLELLQQPITLGFIILMILVFFVDLKRMLSHSEPCEDNLRSVLVNLGLLGTFIGIFMGLLDFDSSDSIAIAKSVPILLEGLRFAFLTSISGIALMTLLNLIESFRYRHRKHDKQQQQNIATHLEKIIRQLATILQYLKQAEPVSKLDAQGELLSANATSWNAILDNLNRTTWLIASPTHPLITDLIKLSEVKKCVASINQQKYLGHADWKIPSSLQLNTLHKILHTPDFNRLIPLSDCWYCVQNQDDSLTCNLMGSKLTGTSEKGKLILYFSDL